MFSICLLHLSHFLLVQSAYHLCTPSLKLAAIYHKDSVGWFASLPMHRHCTFHFGPWWHFLLECDGQGVMIERSSRDEDEASKVSIEHKIIGPWQRIAVEAKWLLFGQLKLQSAVWCTSGELLSGLKRIVILKLALNLRGKCSQRRANKSLTPFSVKRSKKSDFLQ